jgi:hypothetical protein
MLQALEHARWNLNPQVTCRRCTSLSYGERVVQSQCATPLVLWTFGSAVHTDDEQIMVESSSNAVPSPARAAQGQDFGLQGKGHAMQSLLRGLGTH